MVRRGVRRGGRPRQKKRKVSPEVAALRWGTASEVKASLGAVQRQLCAGGLTGRDHKSLVAGARAITHVLSHQLAVRRFETDREVLEKLNKIEAFLVDLKEGRDEDQTTGE